MVHVAQIHMEGLLEQRSQLADLGVAVVHASGGMDAVNKLYGGDFRVRPAVFLPRHGFRTVPSCRTLYPAAQIDQQHLHRDQACRQYVVARGELRFLVQYEAAAFRAEFALRPQEIVIVPVCRPAVVILVEGQVAFHHPLGSFHRPAVVRFGYPQAAGTAALYLIYPVIVQQPARQGGLVVFEVTDFLLVPAERTGERIRFQLTVLGFQVRNHLPAGGDRFLSLHAGGSGSHAPLRLLQQCIEIFFHHDSVSGCL